MSDQSDQLQKPQVGDLVKFQRSTSPTSRGNLYIVTDVMKRGLSWNTGAIYCIKPVYSFMGTKKARRVNNADLSELTPVNLVELGQEFMRFQTFIEKYVKGKSV